MDGERVADLLVGRVRIPVEQRLRPDDHAGNAVAALGGLLDDEGLRDRMEMPGSPSPSSVTTARTPERASTALAQVGSHLAVDQNLARDALLEPAAVLGADRPRSLRST